MKTKELIEQLLIEDPSGELEVTVGKTPIHFLETKPGYWDGPYQILERDPANLFYNIIGGVITTVGKHVSIRTLSIRDAIMEDAKLHVKIIMPGSPERVSDYEETIEEWRETSIRINKEVNEWMASNNQDYCI